jgi:hypothetical protein
MAAGLKVPMSNPAETGPPGNGGSLPHEGLARNPWRAAAWRCLITITLALLCVVAAYVFEAQGREAFNLRRHAAREAARLTGARALSAQDLPDPGKYSIRAWAMFYVAVAVAGFSFIMAVRHKDPADWIGGILAAIIALLIPTWVIWCS